MFRRPFGLPYRSALMARSGTRTRSSPWVGSHAPRPTFGRLLRRPDITAPVDIRTGRTNSYIAVHKHAQALTSPEARIAPTNPQQPLGRGIIASFIETAARYQRPAASSRHISAWRWTPRKIDRDQLWAGRDTTPAKQREIATGGCIAGLPIGLAAAKQGAVRGRGRHGYRAEASGRVAASSYAGP